MYQTQPAHVRMREFIESTRKLSGRISKRYPGLEDAYERMHDANSHLRTDQARHLTIHGSNQNEDGTYSWKFDNYTHIMAPYDMSMDQSHELWGRIECPVLLVSGSESWMANRQGDPTEFFQNASHVKIDDAGHWVHHDQLDEFLTLTQDFLGS